MILDRGIFDALCWFEWLVAGGKMDEEQRQIAEKFLLMKELVGSIDIVFAFCVRPEISIEREYANLLTDKLGTIMNKEVLSSYLEAIETTIENRKHHFHSIFKIDTSNKEQNDVGWEVTSQTLNELKDLLMERVGYFEKTNELLSRLSLNEVTQFEKIKDILPYLNFDVREKVESNDNFLQPIPVAVLTNITRDKVLVIRKNEQSVTLDSPERGKDLIYVGGHSRFEDQTESMLGDFMSVCKMAVKREVKEEIGISISLDNVIPFFIYRPTGEKSKNHMAICFVVVVNENSIKLQLDSTELVLPKGKSKSGKFWPVDRIQELELEDWSKKILNHYFNISALGQMTMFDVGDV